MAVDTETKRRSALGMLIMALVVAPVPDDTIAAVDREHILGIYAGIAPGLPVNFPPVADAGADQTVFDADNDRFETVTLDGSGSSDPEDAIVSYTWSDDLGDTIPDGVASTVLLSVGVHTITLTVTDDGDETDTDTVTITIRSLWTPETVTTSTWTPETGATSTWTPSTIPTTNWS